MLPWMFAYDHQNYSRFLTYYWSQMTRLPTTHTNIFNEFLLGNFAVRRTPGKFNKVPSDQCIGQTINRKQKGHGGIKGYSYRFRLSRRGSVVKSVEHMWTIVLVNI